MDANVRPALYTWRYLQINVQNRKSSNAWSPQSNAIIEQVHQVRGDNQRMFDPKNADLTGPEPFEEVLTAITYAV